MQLFLCVLCTQEKDPSCLPDGFRGTGDLPYLLLGVLKENGIDGKSERQLEKVKAYSGEESKKEGNVCLDWRHIHSSVRAERISSVPSALYTALITLTGPSISPQPHNSATAHINGKRKEKETWGK